ncbi:phage BR0599 family protein [Budviciaceae bacterium CWB-B4]|uniref:Phage BR0599 family protein n=1 Tax=Limnobaculum xujianqingii TaxID=2738837 RepID=A0A9D7AH16_9GAMM|nr:phage BR0599 family protein [Limnobaculum xujianqingii]MBK5072579.1 phage BR0599 family protein [Limnobaculum xujianqingii]MBK5175888.1 phage BR0599 family protein [Limnobaculum xujianqingii]
MSWNEFENSIADGQPVEFYEFSRDNTLFYRFTNADRDMSFNGRLWTATAIQCPGISIGSGDGLEITVPASNPVALMFRGAPPSGTVSIRIYRQHASDPSGQFRIVWVGTVNEVKREATDRAKLVTNSVASTFSRNGLRLTWSRSCPYSLYDHNCKVNKAQFAVSGLTIQALDGANIAVTLPGTIPDGWFSGGILEWTTDGLTERRGLKAQSGNVLGVFGGTSGLITGQSITLYPGCDRVMNTCSNKFNNHLNYGGCPQMPGVSPFGIIKLF